MDDRTAIRVRRLAVGMIAAGIVGTILSVWIADTRDPKEIEKAIEAAFGFQSQEKR